MVNKIPNKYECPPDICLLKFINTHLDIYYNLGFTTNMITTSWYNLWLITYV